jgi:hypothetical protein
MGRERLHHVVQGCRDLVQPSGLTKDNARFQPATATGKLNAVIMPTTPSGFHVSIKK